MISNSESVVSWRQRTKLKALQYLGNQCMICGYNKCIAALHFHHINSDEKDFRISSVSLSWDKIKKELDKCQLLCANCHAEIHYKPVNIKLLVIAKPYHCITCGKEVSTNKIKQCIDCYIRPKKIEWPSIDELKNRLEKSNYSKLGRELGVSGVAIKKHIKRNS